jgi:hypothetical protein
LPPLTGFPVTAFLLVLAAVLLAAVVVTIAALRRAPEGFEDESGFHRTASPGARVAVNRHAGPTGDDPVQPAKKKMPAGALIAS